MIVSLYSALVSHPKLHPGLEVGLYLSLKVDVDVALRGHDLVIELTIIGLDYLRGL